MKETKHIIRTLILLGGLAGVCLTGCKHSQENKGPIQKEPAAMNHSIAAGDPGRFCGWPANNGLWTWNGGREILVGFSYGDFVEQSGHNLKGKSDQAEGVRSRLARSRDGGRTWAVEDPESYVGDGGTPVASPGGFAFDDPGFVLRVVGTSYHGAKDPRGSFFVSTGRGKTWRGPYRFGSLMDDPNLQGMVFTARTRYLATGRDACLLFFSAKPEGSGMVDKSFVAETTDGGKTFHFVSWIVPLADPYRAVMPAVARMKDGTIIAALRRRNPGDNQTSCWVDCYGSKDRGRTWAFLSKVGETGGENGNPPGLTLLRDGRLACAYGDRTRAKLFARLSQDGGRNWGEETVLRDDFQTDKFGDRDFGYPQLTTNHRGELVALYYWATQDHPQQQIAVTMWTPPGLQ